MVCMFAAQALCSSPLQLLLFFIRAFLLPVPSVLLSHRWDTQLPGRAIQPGQADQSLGIQISATFHVWDLRPLTIPVRLFLCPVQASGWQSVSQRLLCFLY